MNSLVNIMIVTTRKCNLNCSHCYNKSGPFKKDVLGENDIEAIIKDICTLQQEYTIERVTVTGGEFLILPNSLWILSRIKSVLKVKTRVETNGIIFLSHPEIIIKYPIDELFVSTDYFHNTLKKDGTSEVLDNLLRIRNNQKIIVRVTLSKGDDTTKSLFLSHYRDIQDLDIEFKYVSPSGRAYENIKEFSGYTLKENPSLFKCKAGDSFLVDLSKKWYACYTNCDLSMVCEVGDAYLLEKMKSVRTDRMNHILSTGQIDFNISDRNNYFYSKKFYYRCEPCLFAQQLNSKKLIVVNLPAVDPTQDAYIKGFIFPTFSEKYLVPMLQNAGLKTEFLDLNLGDIKEQIQKINNTDSLVYIHLTANKYYSYNLFRQLVSTRRIILGGPMPRFCRELFTDEIILDDELEENGICRLFNIENGNLLWERDTFQPACIQPNVDNESVINDFGNVILAGRGCIYQCAFCIHSVFHRKIHMRSVVSLKAELDGESFPSNCLHEDDVKKISIFISEFVSVASLYPSVNKEYLHWINITPKHYEKLPKNILGKVNELRSSIESESVKKQFIHYDMNIGNLLVNNRIGLIDFDTVCIGDKNADIAGFLYSIWNVNFLLGICADEYYFKTVTEKMFETMSLEVVDIKRIDLFMQYRRLFLFTVFYEAIKNSNSEYYKMMVDSINNNTSFLGDLYE